MKKKRPYLDEGIVKEAVKLWKEKHGEANFPESPILEAIIKEWIKGERGNEKREE